MGKIKTYVLFLVVGLILIGSALVINRVSSYTLADLATHTSAKIENKVNSWEPLLEQLIEGHHGPHKEEYYLLFEKERTGLYLYQGDSLLFWNNAQIPVSDSLLRTKKSSGLILLKKGYYVYKSKQVKGLTAFALSLIKSKYDLQNNHLQNDFSNWTKMPKELELASVSGGTNDIQLEGVPLFSLKGSEDLYYNNTYNRICILLFLVGSFVFSISLLLILKTQRRYWGIVSAVSLLSFIKLLLLLNPPLNFLAETFLYDVRVFGNARSIFNATLADILYNSIALLFLALTLLISFNQFKNEREKNLKIILLFALAFFTIWQFNHSIKSLVSNSTLSFDFLNVFNIKPAAIFAILALVLNSVSLFIVLFKACSYFNKIWIRSFTAYMSYILAVCIVLHIIAPNDTWFQNYWPLFLAASLFTIIKLQYQKFSLGLGILIAVMSATLAVFFTHYIDKNQEQKLKLLSENLSQRRDIYLENEFIALPAKIENDKNLLALTGLFPYSKNEVEQLLKQRYFRGYFNTYNVEFSIFDPECRPMLTPSQPVLLNAGYFEDKIRNFSDSTFSKALFFVEKHKKNAQYIGKMQIGNYTLYLQLEPKKFEEMGSFPDLLLDQSQQKQEELKNFSYAVYRGDQKTSSYGEYDYPYYLIDSAALSVLQPEYLHHYFTTDDLTNIIISQKAKDWKYYFTYNSYLFLFFSIVSFTCYYLYALLFTADFKTSSLTRRIQTIIIVLLLLAMSSVGITSGNLVSKQFASDNIKQLEEKTQTIISELSDNREIDEIFSVSQKELINLKLQEYAHLYSSDISLFDSRGALFNTSQPKLYELGLAASVANPRAYFTLKHQQASNYHVTEKAGTLDYLSLYTPVFNDRKQLLGFVNLPYFAKQSDLTNELSNIISALINVYIILFILSIVAGLILAGYITKPLRLIQKQIANITLGTQNETLTWESNDEVGKLVNEYNKMLMKLEQSANLLAQSERESAWREMAKQVAHEIKNPLTPMKLNLQYLQHLKKSKPEDFDERFEKASNSIIEQIDTLAGIASEFSTLARLPGTQLQVINLLEVIHSMVHLFEQEKNSNIQVDIELPEIMVLGDKEQALRVFNNIIQNALHATQDCKQPEISITATETTDTFIIRVADNGCGIEEEMKSKIFTPNFTTKTTGSGLGLAMVKSIVTDFGGKIWFTSNQNAGAQFFIEFKKG
jgi:two-component system, NtrC family, nitrogen regulation sensor histidine kinase NtrY